MLCELFLLFHLEIKLVRNAIQEPTVELDRNLNLKS